MGPQPTRFASPARASRSSRPRWSTKTGGRGPSTETVVGWVRASDLVTVVIPPCVGRGHWPANALFGVDLVRHPSPDWFSAQGYGHRARTRALFPIVPTETATTFAAQTELSRVRLVHLTHSLVRAVQVEVATLPLDGRRGLIGRRRV